MPVTTVPVHDPLQDNFEVRGRDGSVRAIPLTGMVPGARPPEGFLPGEDGTTATKPRILDHRREEVINKKEEPFPRAIFTEYLHGSGVVAVALFVRWKVPAMLRFRHRYIRPYRKNRELRALREQWSSPNIPDVVDFRKEYDPTRSVIGTLMLSAIGARCLEWFMTPFTDLDPAKMRVEDTDIKRM